MKSSWEGNCFRLTGGGGEVTLQGDSAPVKNRLGGKRRGAGRKLNLARRLLKRFSREAIA
jgi:hypothetical protein